jgi:ABC-2 type transport system permease protein
LRRLLLAVRNWLIVAFGFIRRELIDIAGQPRLLTILVLGPFAILLLFGGGYRNETISLRTTFVVPHDGGIRSIIEENEDLVVDYIVPVAYTTDLVEARRQLTEGDVDLVVVFPPDAIETIRSGERARIVVLHDKLDPIQREAVNIATRVAVQAINAEALSQAVAMGQERLEEEGDSLTRLQTLSDRLTEATEGRSEAEIEQATEELSEALESTSLAVRTSKGILASLGSEADEAELERIERLEASLVASQRAVDELAANPSSREARDDALEVNRSVQALAGPLEEFRALPADVIVRPFSHQTGSIVGRSIDPVDFFVPSALALLLQHAGMTFAALTIVRDRDLGFTELYRVGSTPASAMLTGKALAFLAFGGIMGVLLIAIIDIGLGVGVSGQLTWLAAVVALLLASAIAAGLVLSALSRSDTQAVQYAMLFLLTSLFFGGFFLDLDALRYPFKALSWLLPVTYAIRALQDVILRGETPATIDLVGLGLGAVVAGTIAWILTRRELRAR